VAEVQYIDYANKKVLLMDFANIADARLLSDLVQQAIRMVRETNAVRSLLALIDIRVTHSETCHRVAENTLAEQWSVYSGDRVRWPEPMVVGVTLRHSAHNEKKEPPGDPEPREGPCVACAAMILWVGSCYWRKSDGLRPS